MKSLAEINLNEAFGFATIIAAIDGVKDVFSKPLADISLVSTLFFVYFVVFRVKMYLDDEAHDFSQGGTLDITIALLSWIFFLISAASMDDSVRVAIQWFILALLVSTVWTVWSFVRCRHQPGAARRYTQFIVFNLFHIVLLALLTTDFLWFDLALGRDWDVGVLVLLTVAVLVDWRLMVDCEKIGEGAGE